MFHAKTGREVILIVALLLVAALAVVASSNAATLRDNCKSQDGNNGRPAKVSCYAVPGLKWIKIHGKVSPSESTARLTVVLDCFDGGKTPMKWTKVVRDDFTFELSKESTPTAFQLMSKSFCDFTVTTKLLRSAAPRPHVGFKIAYLPG